jgi:DtxR family Mn-dependent transcriptional regulator
VSDLIDTTEMYLRTIFELQEEGVPPLRARIAERLGQSGPTVSQTVARMDRDGLVTIAGDRHLELTPVGLEAAIRVMRKHRLAECLLVDLIGLPLEEVHAEACRWEHVISESVEVRLLEVLGHPVASPFGNLIPGLDRLVPGEAASPLPPGREVMLADVVTDQPRTVVVRRIGEAAHADPSVVVALRRAGVQPGASVRAQRSSGGVLVGSGGETAELPVSIAGQIAVESD